MGKKHKPTEDLYESFKRFFTKLSKQELVDKFNNEVGNRGWTSARSIYLHELREAMIDSGIDCSKVINESGGFNLDKNVKLLGNQLAYVNLPTN
jgi:hypothetical protein